MRCARIAVACVWTLAALLGHAQDARPELSGVPGVQPQTVNRFAVWGFDVYDARLWTAPDFEVQHYARHIFALELQYLRKLQGQAIAERSIDEMRRIGQLSQAKAQEWLQTMRQVFPDVAQGDRITGVHLPGQGAEFWVNGRRAGQVADPQFARLFFGIWLDERSSEPQLRTRLIKGLKP